MKLSHVICLGLTVLMLGGHVVTDANASETIKERREARKAQSSKASKPEVKYPDAVREEPKPAKSSKVASKIKRVVDAYNKEQYEKAIAAADVVLADPKANAHDKATAAQIAGYAWNSIDSDESYAQAARYLQISIDADALPNNDHFDMMYGVSQMLFAEDKLEESLAMSERFLKESKAERPLMYALRGSAFYGLERFPEAIESLKKAIAIDPDPDKNWKQVLMASYIEMDQAGEAAKIAEEMAAKEPDNKAVQMNLARIFLQADMGEKAAQVVDSLRAKDLLTDSKDYETAYRLLANIDGREKDAIAVINEGLENNRLSPSLEVYNFLAQSYYFSEQIEPAIAAWKKAAPLDTSGETYLNLAKVQVMEGHYVDGKASAQQALAKGVKKPGDAWMAIARAEFGDEGTNRAAILAAYREAAKYPETKAQATKAIAQMSR